MVLYVQELEVLNLFWGIILTMWYVKKLTRDNVGQVARYYINYVVCKANLKNLFLCFPTMYYIN